MKAIVRNAFGGPEQLDLREVPDPRPAAGDVLVRVRAFGINRAEQYFRRGLWGAVDAISGIECVGEVERDTRGELAPGTRVLALMGGLGRSRPGSYAERTCVPGANVVAIRTTLPWTRLAALPETFATAWSCVHDNLALQAGQRVLVRGATSALGQAAVELAVLAGATVVASVRRPERGGLARELGASAVVLEDDALPARIAELAPAGLDAVLDLVGTRTILQSLRLLRRGGRACLAGFLGGSEPLERLDPLADLASGRHLSLFASAFVYGTPGYPLADVPFQHLVELAERGAIARRPPRVFRFDEIRRVHALLDDEAAGGKMVVETPVD